MIQTQRQPVQISGERCTGCGLCVRDCFPQALAIRDGKSEIVADTCMQCGHCFAICPSDAVSLPGLPVDDVERPGDCAVPSPRELLHLIKMRRSIRRFQNRPLERETVAQLLQAGRYLPTGGNAQNVTYTVVQELLPTLKPLVWESMRKSLATGELSQPAWETYAVRFRRRLREWDENHGNDQLFFNAPALLVISSPSEENGSIAAAGIELMAGAMGLGCLFSGFIRRCISYSEEAQALLDLRGAKVSNCMLVGYPGVTYLRSTPRRQLGVRWK